MTRAYVETFHGYVPCDVLSISTDEFGVTYLKVKMTSNKGNYVKGEKHMFTARNVIPEGFIYKDGAGKYQINTYDWKTIAPHLYVD